MRQSLLLSLCLPLVFASVARAQSAATDPQQAYAGLDIYYGDLHDHTYYSSDARCNGLSDASRTPSTALQWARDMAQLDFCSVTDHSETFDCDTPGTAPNYMWQDSVQAANYYNQDGVFTAFPGWEWTGCVAITANSVIPVTTATGHKCVIWNGTNPPPAVVSAHDKSTPTALWAALDAYCAQTPGADYLTNAHSPACGGENTDWSFVNAQRQRLVEIFSFHGSSEGDLTYLPVVPYIPNGSVQNALGRWATTGDPGYQLGIISSTDRHTGHPGNVFELYGNDGANGSTIPGSASGGHAVCFASEKSRDAIFAGLKSRLTYGTSGARIQLWFTVTTDKAANVRMGQATTASTGTHATLNMKAIGQQQPVSTMAQYDTSTGRIESFEIVRDGQTVAVLGQARGVADNVAVSWTDPSPITGPSYYYVRALQAPTATYEITTALKPLTNPEQRSERAWSSPVWITTAGR